MMMMMVVMVMVMMVMVMMMMMMMMMIAVNVSSYLLQEVGVHVKKTFFVVGVHFDFSYLVKCITPTT